MKNHEIYENEIIEDVANIIQKEAERYPLLTKEEEIDLAERIKAGDDSARTKFIKCNYRLVVNIANKIGNGIIPFEDRFNSGVIGLIHAVDHFDYTRGKFSTIATLYIRQSIVKQVDANRHLYYVPGNYCKDLRKLLKVENEYIVCCGKKPSKEELAQLCGFTAEEVETLLMSNRGEVSFDDPLGEDDDMFLEDVIKDECAADPYEMTVRSLENESVHEAMGSLTELEQKVIKHTFGLDGHKESTIDEISKELGFSREGVRMLRGKACRKLEKKLGEAHNAA